MTRDGFGDKYNYGCPAFLATEEGMYIGTCNPFYGGQLYLLTNSEYTGVNDIADKAATQNSNIYYTLTGVRIVGKPYIITLIPAMLMTAVCTTFLLVSPAAMNLPHWVGAPASAAVAALSLVWFYAWRHKVVNKRQA